MLISFATRFATLSSIFRSRAALELENLALRHQIGVLQRSARKRPRLTPIDRLLWVWLSRGWSGLALGAGHRSTRHRPCLASCWLPPVLDWESPAWPTGTARRFSRASRSDPQDVPGESELGCTPHPRGVAEAWHQNRGEQREQIHGALSPAAVTDLAHLLGESRPAAGLHRLLYPADPSLPG